VEPESLPPRPTFTPLEASEAGAETKISGLLRFAWVFAGVLLPPVCFAVDLFGRETPKPSLSGYALLLLSREVALPLYPLLLICMASLALLAWRPAEYAANGWVRLGIVSGVVLSMEYWFVFQAAMSGANGDSPWWSAGFECLWGALWSGFAVLMGWFLLRTFVNVASVNWRVAIPSAFVLIVLALIVLVSLPWSIVFAGFLCLLFSTPWAVAVYVSAAVWLVRRRKRGVLQFTLWQLMVATTWLALHFAAWRMAVLIMLDKNAGPPQ
jgi:hypothetical protein